MKANIDECRAEAAHPLYAFGHFRLARIWHERINFVPLTPSLVIITLPSSSAPWWGVPLIAGVAALVGSLITFWTTRASDLRKAKREEECQWDDEIRSESRKFLTSAAKISEALSVLHKKDAPDPDVKAAQILFDEHNALIREHLDGLLIIAPGPVMQKALRIYAKLLAIKIHNSGATWASRMAIRDHSTEMLTALRKEIGVRHESDKSYTGTVGVGKKSTGKKKGSARSAPSQ